MRLTAYADDGILTSTHNTMCIGNANIQSYIQELHAWTHRDRLILNRSRTACTLFASDPAEYITQLELQMDNITLPMNINPIILGLPLDPKLTYNKHMESTNTKACNTIQMLNTLTSTTWGEIRKRSLQHTKP